MARQQDDDDIDPDTEARARAAVKGVAVMPWRRCPWLPEDPPLPPPDDSGFEPAEVLHWVDDPPVRLLPLREAIDRTWREHGGDPAYRHGGVADFQTQAEQYYGGAISKRTIARHLVRLRKEARARLVKSM